MFDLLQPTHLIFIFLVALVVFGPRRMAEISQSLGRNLQKFKEYKDELKGGLLRVSNEDKPKEEEKHYETSQSGPKDEQANPNQAKEITEEKTQGEDTAHKKHSESSVAL